MHCPCPPPPSDARYHCKKPHTLFSQVRQRDSVGRNFTKRVLPLLLVVAGILTGCATGRTYHAWSSTWQLGYQETALRSDLYRVSYTGYGLAPETCYDFAMLRAAEITLANGAQYFEIMSESQSASTQTYALPGSTITTGQTYANGAFSAVSTSYAFSGSIDRPTAAILVRIRKNDSSTAACLEARSLAQSLREKHKLRN